MKKIIISIFICLIFFTFVSLSSASLGTFNKGDCVPIVTNVNATSVTLSIVTGPPPNPQILLINKSMSSQGSGAFNYSFCDTQKIGTYTYGYTLNDGETFNNDFIIGSDYIFLYLIGIGILILLFSFLLKNQWLVFVAGVLFIVAGIFIMSNGLVGFNDLYSRTIGYVLIGLGLLFEIAAGYETLHQGAWGQEGESFDED